MIENGILKVGHAHMNQNEEQIIIQGREIFRFTCNLNFFFLLTCISVSPSFETPALFLTRISVYAGQIKIETRNQTPKKSNTKIFNKLKYIIFVAVLFFVGNYLDTPTFFCLEIHKEE